MSQFYVGVTAGSLPPVVATQFTSDNATVAIPAANNLNVFSDDSSSNIDNGIQTTASGSTLTINLTNRITGSVTTTDATITTILTLPMGATPGTFYVYGNVQAFNSSTPVSGAYSFTGGFRTDGVTATELGVELHDEFEDAALITSDIFISASAGNIILQVQGVAGLSINWNSLMEYRLVV